MRRLRRSGIGCVAVLALTCGNAGAIQVFQLDESGNRTLVPVAWSLCPDGVPGGVSLTDVTGGARTDWEILLGVKEFGSPEDGEQGRGIYGAGARLAPAFGYRVEFGFDGYTWDAYSLDDDDGVARGYWDLFAVGLNQERHYWDSVLGGSGVLPDPVVTLGDDGVPVSSSGLLPGVTWGWGGADFAEGGFEQLHGSFWIESLGEHPEADYFLSVVLDTNTPEFTDTAYPSWGGFDAARGVTSPRVPVPTPEPATLVLLTTGFAALAAWRSSRRTFRTPAVPSPR